MTTHRPPRRLLTAAAPIAAFGLSLMMSAAPAAASGQTQTAPAAKAASTPTLFQRLGGLEAIRSVVDDFVARVGADTRINSYFAVTDLAKLKGHLTDQICQATGGPCTYTGKDMKSAHAGMRISSSEFDALMESLMAALEKHKVAKADAGALAGMLLPMRADIVSKP